MARKAGVLFLFILSWGSVFAALWLLLLGQVEMTAEVDDVVAVTGSAMFVLALGASLWLHEA